MEETGDSVETKVLTKQELCLIDQIPSPCAIIIFGASGDLAFRKLFPSLFHLFTNKLMPSQFCVLGVARTSMSESDFRAKVFESLPSSVSESVKNNFLEHVTYFSGNYDDKATYAGIKERLKTLDARFQFGMRCLYYLSTPPSVYGTIIHHLGQAQMANTQMEDASLVRTVIEKPFGDSYSSAHALNLDIRRVFRERQIYRIDHYLGKETVQNILMFRFANIMFEPVWNRNFIDHVQITATEKIGIEHRAGYYEQSGVLRDMFQNHLLQLVALIAMEAPSSLSANTVRDRRLDVLKAIRHLSLSQIADNTVCGQYVSGHIDQKPVDGYRQEKNVSPESRIPTFSAIKFEVDNWRWQGVPFYVRSGKRMADRLIQIEVHFKRVPTSIFKPLTVDQLSPNVLKFRIQPNEGITMQFEAKHPGPKLCMSTVTMDFGYQQAFKAPPPESYARLFQDAMLGDQTLFSRSDEVEESWRIIDPIVNYWADPGIHMPSYPAGSWGPKESNALLNKHGHAWG